MHAFWKLSESMNIVAYLVENKYYFSMLIYIILYNDIESKYYFCILLILHSKHS